MVKKIAIIYSGSRFGGGVDTYYANLFKSYSKKDVELVIISLGKWPLLDKLDKNSYKVFSGARFNPLTVLAIAKTLIVEDYRLVVTNGVVSNAYGRAAALLSARPVLTVIHSEHDFDYPNKILRRLYAVIEKLTRWKTATYITVSEYLKDGLIKNGIKSGKIAVIYNAVTPLPIKKTTKKKDLVIGSIGRLHPVKNYDALISAMKDLPKEAKLVIAGEGEERESLEKIIVENSLGDRVELLGYVKDIPGFLSSVDIYVQPSLSEGFGLTVIEAMQAGLAVVVSPGGALPELVEDGKTGIVAKGFSAKELTGALNKVIEDKKLRSELAEAGKKEALNKFKVEEWADKTVEAYLGVAK